MNNQIFFFLYNYAHHYLFLDKTIIFFADTLPYIVIILALLFLIFHHEAIPNKNIWNDLRNYFKKIHEIIFVFFAGVFAWCIASILKIIIHTPRPFDLFTNVHSLIPETGFAFPSGHATFYSALAVSLFFCNKKIGYLFMFFALLIGLARIVAGVHFPIDILGGFVLGTLISISVKRFFN